MPAETRQPVICASCGWTGKRMTGNPVWCPNCGRLAAFQKEAAMKSPTQQCNHQHQGDTILAVWVCGNCWAKVGERPRRYVMVPCHEAGGGGSGYRQELVWTAEVAKDGDLRMNRFVRRMADRYMARCRDLTLHDAHDCALDYLRSLQLPFGHEDLSDPEGLADEDMEYWDVDEGVSN